jgi:hypothetical protein
MDTGYDFYKLDYPIPEWADRLSDGNRMVVGTQLCTRDGRRVGNAVVVDDKRVLVLGEQTLPLIKVVTDKGNSLNLTESEAIELFHDPIYVMKEEDYIGL